MITHAALCRWEVCAILCMDPACQVGCHWGRIYYHSRHCYGVSAQLLDTVTLKHLVAKDCSSFALPWIVSVSKRVRPLSSRELQSPYAEPIALRCRTLALHGQF